MTAIPTGWRVVPLEQLVEILDGRRIPVSASERVKRPGEVPYYGASGQVGTIDKALFDEPLLLLGEDGVQFFDPLKSKAYQIRGRSWVNNHAHVLRVKVGTEATLLEHYLNQFDYRGFANGTTRLKLTQAAMRRIPVVLPDFEEQRRIVAILEEHLSDLDDAAGSLRRASARSQLLVARSLSLVRSGDELPLPQVAAIQGGIQKQAKRAPRSNAFPFLRVANVTASGLDLREVHQVELFNDELGRHRLQAGDLLVVEGNGSPSQIGRAALWDDSIPDCVHQNHLIRVRPDQSRILPVYLEAVWNSPENRSVLTDVASSSSGLHTLSVRKLAHLGIPVPSLETQRVAVTQLGQVRDSTSRLQSSISAALARGDSLRRAVLAAAFSGRLTGASSDTDVIAELAEQESA